MSRPLAEVQQADVRAIGLAEDAAICTVLQKQVAALLEYLQSYAAVRSGDAGHGYR